MKNDDKFVDCEACKHFSGLSYTLRFGCEAGHQESEPERISTFLRQSCKDFKQATKAELIAQQHRHDWDGEARIKSTLSQVKRQATSLENLLKEHALGCYLTTKERAGAQQTVELLRKLTPDLTQAARLAAAAEKKRRAEREQRENQLVHQLLAELFPGANSADLLAAFADLRAFSKNWTHPTKLDRNGRPAGASVGVYDSDAITTKAQAYQQSATPANLDAFSRELADVLFRMQIADRAGAPGGVKDFLEYRKFLAMKRGLVPDSDE